VYRTKDIEPELSFMEIKSSLKLSLINIFSVQLVFQIFALLFIQVTSYFQTTSSLNLLSPRELSSFVWDMWLIVFLLSFFLVGCSVLNKIKLIPLYFLVSYPAILVVFSMVRDVSLFHVTAFSLLSCASVIQINYQWVKQQEYSKV